MLCGLGKRLISTPKTPKSSNPKAPRALIKPEPLHPKPLKKEQGEGWGAGVPGHKAQLGLRVEG